MRKAVLIAGFNNWGKSTIIFNLFDRRSRFLYGYTYPISGVHFNTLFTVQSQSNDDLWGENFVRRITERINASPDAGENLLSAICPTLDETNNVGQILSEPPFSTYDALYLFLIEYKWEHHAKLLTQPIRNAVAHLPNVHIVVINADQHLTVDHERQAAKMHQIRNELNAIFGIP